MIVDDFYPSKRAYRRNRCRLKRRVRLQVQLSRGYLEGTFQSGMSAEAMAAIREICEAALEKMKD